MSFRSPHVLLTLIAVVIGCAAPPSQPDPLETIAAVQLSRGPVETVEFAISPTESEPAGAHPIDFYVRRALERNPEIVAAQQQVAARTEVIPQATALEDPMLVDTFMPFDDHSVQTAAGRGTNNLTLSQRFPWFGKLRLRGEVAEQTVQIALARLVQAELKVTEDVHLACYEIAFAQQAIEITERDRGLLEQLLEIAVERQRVGASLQDVFRAEVELNQVDNRLIELRRQLRVAQADLAKLLDAPPETELLVEDELEAPSAPEAIDTLYEAAIRCRPELQERLYAITRNQRSEELARLDYYPDVTAGIGWQAITANDALSAVADGNDNLAFTIGVNLPIWREKLRAAVREAEHRTVESVYRYDAERDDTFRQIRRRSVEARALENQITLFRDSVIPNAERTFEASRADYRVGKVDFLQVIDNWSQLLAFQVQLERFEASLAQRLASLERVVGCQLASLPVPVNIDGSVETGEMPVLQFDAPAEPRPFPRPIATKKRSQNARSASP